MKTVSPPLINYKQLKLNNIINVECNQSHTWSHTVTEKQARFDFKADFRAGPTSLSSKTVLFHQTEILRDVPKAVTSFDKFLETI
jgi:hypothetical protein